MGVTDWLVEGGSQAHSMKKLQSNFAGLLFLSVGESSPRFRRARVRKTCAALPDAILLCSSKIGKPIASRLFSGK